MIEKFNELLKSILLGKTSPKVRGPESRSFNVN